MGRTKWLMIHHLVRSTQQCTLIWSDNLQLPFASKLPIWSWRIYEIRQPPTCLFTTPNPPYKYDIWEFSSRSLKETFGNKDVTDVTDGKIWSWSLVELRSCSWILINLWDDLKAVTLMRALKPFGPLAIFWLHYTGNQHIFPRIQIVKRDTVTVLRSPYYMVRIGYGYFLKPN